MIYQDSVVVQLIRLIESIPSPPPPPRRRGRPIVYSEKLFMKALVVMIVRRLHRVGEFLAVLQEPTPEMSTGYANFSVRMDASPRGAPSSGGSKPYLRGCQLRLAAWDATWSGCSLRGRDPAERWPLTPPYFALEGECGTRRTKKPAECLTLP